MSFMELQISQKGRLYSADCRKCGTTSYTHECTNMDHNERRDAMENGTLCCDQCGATVSPETFSDLGRQYAGRYSAAGYMDCTDWSYDTNKRRLVRYVRAMYGE